MILKFIRINQNHKREIDVYLDELTIG